MVECLDENPFAAPPPQPQPAADDDGDDDEDVAITGSKGKNALQHFLHCRENCVVHLFATDPAKHCSQCFCMVCDVPASRCAAWPQHCGLKYADPSTQRLRRDARAAALIQQAGGAPAAATPAAGAAIAQLTQPDVATSMTALLRAVTQVWPVEALAPPGLAPGTALRPYQRQSLAFMLDLENASDSDPRVARCPLAGRSAGLWLKPNGAPGGRLRAGWICDEVGMGKTLSVISLILARPRTAHLPSDAAWRALQRRHPFGPTVNGPTKTLQGFFADGNEISASDYYKATLWGEKEDSDGGTHYKERFYPNPARAAWTEAAPLPGGAKTLTLKATVISCPVTLIGQWHDEVNKWAPNLHVLVNHGSHADRKALERGN